MNNNVKKTVMEMLNDRNCTYEIEDPHTFTAACTKTSQPILVLYIDDPKLGIQSVKSIESKMKDYSVRNSIVIYDNNLTSFAKTAIVNMKQDGYDIELFTTKELSYNVTKHVLVPQHTLLDASDKAEILEFFRITEKRLPFILYSDPVARYYGAKPGDLFQINRKTEGVGTNPYFRVVT